MIDHYTFWQRIGCIVRRAINHNPTCAVLVCRGRFMLISMGK